MIFIDRRGLSPQKQAELDNANAKAQTNADLIEYIAMMTDVEIPTSEEENADEQEV